VGHIQTYRIEVHPRIVTTHNKWVTTAHQLGLSTLTGCSNARIFFVAGELAQADVERISRELLTDSVTENFVIGTAEHNADHVIDVTLQPGVTDPVAENLIRAAKNFGVVLEQAATGQRYLLTGNLSAAELKTLATKVLCNTVIQRYAIDEAISAPFIAPKASEGLVERIDIREADDDELLAISKERRLSLDLNEMKAIQSWYRQEGREPTDIELEMVAQTWSEHCVHKTFRALIHFEDEDGNTETIDGLLKQYIRAATERVNKEWVRSAFVDNAGIVKFNDEFDLAFKVETHNHPSALEPFGGANTGVGGVVRDVLGVSAKPIANTDVLCFGHQDLPESELLEGVLHPRQIQTGVVHGIEDYGNKMGIPTVNGAIFYDNGYTANPLVFCGCLGILPHGSHVTEPQTGDYIVVLGGRTGRDGLRGATFSSMEMDTSTSEIASISVQIGHPINEKQVQEVILRARDEKLYHAITDCGAGGLSSAVGEMGEKLGADVQLQTVLLKYPGLRPWEIWLSEAQERMVMAVAPENWERLQQIAVGQDVEITQIGTFRDDGRLILRYGDAVAGDIGMDLLHDCMPRRELQAKWEKPKFPETQSIGNPDLRETLLKLLSHPNIRSKENIVRRYDHEVQGGTVVKPFVGVREHVGGNSSVIVPIETKHQPSEGESAVRGVALSVGICPQYGELDPYAMAWAAVDEAFRNLVAVGADPDQVSLLDNFCWGNPNLPDRLGSLVLAAKGCHDAAVAYNAPFVSGKDSLNNEYADADGTRHAIPGTLLISAMGIVPDVTKTVTMDLKQAGNLLYVIGETRDEMGGSHYSMVNGVQGGTVPQPNPKALDTMRALHKAIQAGLVQSCHDASEGGIAVALAEMCIAGRWGAFIDLEKVSQDKFNDIVNLFSESTSRFIVEVNENNVLAFTKILESNSIIYSHVGNVAVAEKVLESNSVIHRNVRGKVQYGYEDLLFFLGGWHGAHWVEDGTFYPRVSIFDLEQAYQDQKITSAADVQPETELIMPPIRAKSSRQGAARVLILHANGTNRDHDAALACELAGGEPEIVHINQLLNGERRLLDYHMLVVPGGFSYGDDLGAGQLWAQDLRYKLHDDLEHFARDGRPVLGICNGFQVLLKSGLLPDTDFAAGDSRDVTLTYNERQQFECRWVYLRAATNSTSLFTENMTDLIYCPVAHGEGRVMVRDEQALNRLWHNGQVALTYVDMDGEPVGYPANPNGSVAGIAALCNREGNVMGLMPHPEDHIFPWQHPRYHRGETGEFGLVLFQNGIRYA
jgi:phosphoribosylformylglycinamidine synthase II/phosphoribosylformylglycinamidine synthase I